MRFKAAAASFVLVAGLVLAVANITSNGSRAGAAGGPLQVFVTASIPAPGSAGRLFRFNLGDLANPNAAPTQAFQNPPARGPVAVNVDGSEAIFGTLILGATGAQVPEIGVDNVNTGVVTTTPTSQTVVGIAADPTNPAVAYVLESGGIDRLTIAVSAGVTALTDQRMPVPVFRFGPTSIAISPDGSTLYVGGDGDGFAGVESISIANPSKITTFFGFSGPNNAQFQFDHIADLVVAPNGSALYVAGNVSNPAGVFEGDVLALPTRPFSNGSIWERELQPGTAGGIQLGSPTSLTVSPDGQTVLVGGTNGFGANSTVVAFAASNGTPGATGSVAIREGANFPGSGLASIAVSPDGSEVVVEGEDATDSSFIVVLNAASLQPVQTTPLTARFTPKSPQSLAITPAQVSLGASYSVNVAQAGQSTSFAAATPAVPVAGVSFRYTWNFGDGSPAVSGQSVGHVFTAAASYSVTMQVSPLSPAGTPVDTPGQTPFWRASPAASTQTVVIPAAPPPPTTIPTTTNTTTSTGTGTTTTNQTTTTVAGQKPGTPRLTLNPGVGPPGTIVTVTGSGFRPNTPITVSWSVSSGSVLITSDAHGNLPPRPLMTIIPDVLGPRFAVASSNPQAKAPFLVVPGTAEPGGGSGSYLFRSESQ